MVPSDWDLAPKFLGGPNFISDLENLNFARMEREKVTATIDIFPFFQEFFQSGV